MVYYGIFVNLFFAISLQFCWQNWRLMTKITLQEFHDIPYIYIVLSNDIRAKPIDAQTADYCRLTFRKQGWTLVFENSINSNNIQENENSGTKVAINPIVKKVK